MPSKVFKDINHDYFKIVYNDVDPDAMEDIVQDCKDFVANELKAVCVDDDEIKAKMGKLALLNPKHASKIGEGDVESCYFQYAKAEGRAGEGHIMWARKEDGQFAFYCLITHVKFTLKLDWKAWVKSKGGFWPGITTTNIEEMIVLHTKKVACEKLLNDRAVAIEDLD